MSDRQSKVMVRPFSYKSLLNKGANGRKARQSPAKKRNDKSMKIRSILIGRSPSHEGVVKGNMTAYDQVVGCNVSKFSE